MKKIQKMKNLRKPATALISSVVIGLGISGIYSQISNQDMNYSKGINKGIIKELQEKELDENMDEFVSALDAFNKEYFTNHPDAYNTIDMDTLKAYTIELGTSVEIPPAILVAIIDYYSNGEWNTNGRKSAVGDVGLAQVNLSAHNLASRLRLEFATTYLPNVDAINDPYANINVFALFLKQAMLLNGYTIDDLDYEDIIGRYIGGANWDKYETVNREVVDVMQVLERESGRSF